MFHYYLINHELFLQLQMQRNEGIYTTNSTAWSIEKNNLFRFNCSFVHFLSGKRNESDNQQKMRLKESPQAGTTQD